MKKITKHFAVLTALITALAVCPITAYAENTNSNQPQIDADLILAPETRLNVYVDGEWSANLSESYGFGDKATITAPANSGNKVFSHWTANGSIISYNRTLSLTMNAHTTLYAVYASTAPTAQPVAGFTSITRTNEGDKISFQAIADKDATSVGIVYSTSASGDSLKIGGSGVTNEVAVKLTNSTTALPKSILDNNGCWMLQIKPNSASTVYHARAYVTKNGTTTYGDVKNVNLSDLENGISLIANLGGFESDIDDALNDLNGEIEDTNGKLADGKYKQSAVKDGKYYVRYVFVTPKTEIVGKSKATFTAHHNGKNYTFETNNYYTGMTTNGISYTPKSGDSVMFVVTITSSSDIISSDLTCDLEFE